MAERESDFQWWIRQYPRTFQSVSERWRKTSTLEQMRLTNRASSSNLRQSLSFIHIFFITFGQFLGAGIFVVVGRASLESSGPSIAISVFLAAILAFLSTLTFAEMVSSYPVAGAGFQYVMAVFGELPAWVVGSSSAIGYMCTGGSLARDFSTQLALLCGQTSFLVKAGSLRLDFVAFGIVLLLTTLVIAPALYVSWLNIVLKFAVLVLVIIILSKLFPASDLQNWDEGSFFKSGGEGVFAATATMYYAFAGKDAGIFMAEEVHDPEGTVPQAIIDCCIFSSSIYVLMALALSLSVPLNAVGDVESFVKSPFRQAFVDIGEGSLARLPTVAALISIITVLLIQLLVTTRLFLALARYHFLPSWLAHVDKRTSTPIALTILFGCGKAIVGLLVNPINLRKVRIGCVLLEMSAVAAAVIWRRYHLHNDDDPTTWRSPGARLLLISALSFSFGASYHFDAPWWLLVALLAAIGLIALSFAFLHPVVSEDKNQVHLSPMVGTAVIFGASFLLWQNSPDNEEAVIVLVGIVAGAILVYVLYGVHVSTRHDEAVQLFRMMQEVHANAPYDGIAHFRHLDEDDRVDLQRHQVG